MHTVKWAIVGECLPCTTFSVVCNFLGPIQFTSSSVIFNIEIRSFD
ncbi:hypothetical protein Hdeb2414_s0007g00253861 [Helianthus debilis subsp. tardiflorus]